MNQKSRKKETGQEGTLAKLKTGRGEKTGSRALYSDLTVKAEKSPTCVSTQVLDAARRTVPVPQSYKPMRARDQRKRTISLKTAKEENSQQPAAGRKDTKTFSTELP